MTTAQIQALWELRRQGLQDAADQAEVHWEGDQPFAPSPLLPLNRAIAQLIDCANWDTCEKASPKRHLRASDLTATRYAAAA